MENTPQDRQQTNQGSTIRSNWGTHAPHKHTHKRNLLQLHQHKTTTKTRAGTNSTRTKNKNTPGDRDPVDPRPRLRARVADRQRAAEPHPRDKVLPLPGEVLSLNAAAIAAAAAAAGHRVVFYLEVGEPDERSPGRRRRRAGQHAVRFRDGAIARDRDRAPPRVPADREGAYLCVCTVILDSRGAETGLGVAREERVHLDRPAAAIGAPVPLFEEERHGRSFFFF